MMFYVAALGVVLVLVHGVGGRGNRQEPSSNPLEGELRLALAVTILTLIVGLRWRLGTDYWAYESNYYSGVYSFSFNEPLVPEFGFNALTEAAGWLHDDAAAMFFASALFTIPLIVLTLSRYSPSLPLSIYIFAAGGFWLGSMNGVKQYLACAILFWGHRYILDRKVWAYGLTVLLATTFHVTALVGLLFYFVPQARLTVAKGSVVLAGSLLVMLGYEQVLELFQWLRGEGVTGDYAYRQINPLRALFALFPLVLFWLLSRGEAIGARGMFYLNMGVLHAAVMFASLNSAYLARVGIYTGIFSTLLLPFVVQSRDPRVRVLAVGAVLLLYGIFGVLETASNPNLVPYRWLGHRV